MPKIKNRVCKCNRSYLQAIGMHPPLGVIRGGLMFIVFIPEICYNKRSKQKAW